MPPLRVALLLVTLLAAACTVTRHGSFRLLPEGPATAAVVSLEGETAFVTAVDPASGETFTGRLEPAADQHRQPPAMDPFAGSAIAPGPAGPSGASLMAAGPRTVLLSGTLAGDRGTTLRCEITMEQRLRLRGQGLCQPLEEGSQARYILVF